MERTTIRALIQARLALPEARRLALRQEAMKDSSAVVAGRSDDQRTIQAKRLWDLGFGIELGKTSFEEYLKDIPEIPESLKSGDTKHPLLTLCDPRPGTAKGCEIIGILFNYEESSLPCDDRHATSQTPFWVRFHNGRRNHDRCPSDCRSGCTGDVFTGTAMVMVGIMAYVHYPDIVEEDEYIIYLASRVYLKVCRGRPELSMFDYGRNASCCGSGGFRRE